MKIEELGFDDTVMKVINNASGKFETLAKEEGGEWTMQEWLNKNIKEAEKEDFMKNLTEREKFLYSFGILIGILTEIFDL